MMAQNTGTTDFAQDVPNESSALSQSLQNTTLHDGPATAGDSSLQRASSTMSQSQTLAPSRGGTLKKRQSLSRKGSLKRGNSKKDSRPGSQVFGEEDTIALNPEMNDAFFTPVPTTGSPTEILANRFQVWRKVLKDLITYFRDIQKSYDSRSKALYTLSNVITNIAPPRELAGQGGIGEAVHILRDYHKQAIAEGNKAKSIEEEVILQLTGLRSDLGQKIKEIKSLSGDFKNNVDKETEGSRRAVHELQNALSSAGSDTKSDPFLVRLGVDRQVGKQIEEENYLHRAFLNLESSGRELESIVMGEIQKAYGAYAGIIKREADDAYTTVEKLREGPLAVPKDFEWNAFVHNNEHFVDPKLPVRKIANISYPGKDDPAASEVKAGMLERKSKYLKSYTPGWYILSATHLHEFKSPDRIYAQTPVMSLPLVDQKLGSHSNTDSTSHKFMLKGRQSGGLHRGHAWVFRAESYDTMMAWFSDIKNLTEKTGAERNAFIQRSHARSLSAGSQKAASVSSDDRAMDEDEADQVPYSATESQGSVLPGPEKTKQTQRPSPGGRFPSALNVNRDSQVPQSMSSPSSNGEPEIVAAAAALPGSEPVFGTAGQPVGSNYGDTNAARGGLGNPAAAAPDPYSSPIEPTPGHHQLFQHMDRHDSNYGEWMGPTTAGIGGAAAAAIGIEAYKHRQAQLAEQKASQLEAQPGLQTVETAPTAPLKITTAPPPFTSTFNAPSNAATQLQQSGLSTAPAPVLSSIQGTIPVVATNSNSAAPSSSSRNPDPVSPLAAINESLPQRPPHHPIFDHIGQPGSHAHAANPAEPIRVLANAIDPGEPIRNLASLPPLTSLPNNVPMSAVGAWHVPGDFPQTPGEGP